VIVRVLGGGGQYEVSDDVVARLNELDDRAMAALDQSDEEELDGLLAQMAELVESEGKRLPDDDLSASDLVIPPPDLSLEETRALFSEQGLIPDLPT
jgi:PspAA-like protein